MPVDLRAAREFVAMHHRHNEPPVGHKFSVGVACGDQLVGVAIVGRPVSRVIQSEGATLEVIRTATDGTRNANSMLYGAARRAAFALGYDRLITYTQAGETGASLRAAGFRVVAQRPPRPGWDTPSRRRANKADHVPRTLWDAVPESPGSAQQDRRQ
ncbi:XF1762 family protein [Microbacterium sp.]|uniref:XF1762 family protein n=1 Tax=Actinomycetes TaxID=1760 RepID=UPI0037C9AF47